MCFSYLILNMHVAMLYLASEERWKQNQDWNVEWNYTTPENRVIVHQRHSQMHKPRLDYSCARSCAGCRVYPKRRKYVLQKSSNFAKRCTYFTFSLTSLDIPDDQTESNVHDDADTSERKKTKYLQC